MTIQLKAVEQYFHVVLFTMPLLTTIFRQTLDLFMKPQSVSGTNYSVFHVLGEEVVTI